MKSPLNRGGLRFYLVIIAMLCGILLFDTTSTRTILAGLPCLLLGAWLHTWAKGCLRQNRVVAMVGPYRFVRHPFYLANALIDAGLVIMAGWWPLAFVLPLWWLAIYIPVIRGEERYLTENFPGEYPEYNRRVPCLIPWRRPLPSPASGYPGDGFRWSNPNIAGGEELPRLARILAYPLLFFVAQGLLRRTEFIPFIGFFQGSGMNTVLRRGGLPWLNDGWNLTALGGLIMLYVLAWELHGHQCQQRWILPLPMRSPMLRVVVSAAVLAAVCYIPSPRTSFNDFVPIVGAVLMLLSVPIYSRRPARAGHHVRMVAAETFTLLGVIAAGELLWLAPALVVIYVAWILDWQLGSVQQLSSPTGRGAGGEGDSQSRFSPPYWPYFYPVLAVASAAVIGVKLVGHGLPYHMMMF